MTMKDCWLVGDCRGNPAGPQLGEYGGYSVTLGGDLYTGRTQNAIGFLAEAR